MNKVKSLIGRYRAVIIAGLALAALVVFMPELGPRVGMSLLEQGRTMLLVLPPIFLLLGLLDVWVPRETLMRFMGPGSGFKGLVLSFALGSAAAGPLYGAFPVAAVLMRKGASFSNILIFIGAWSTTKIPMLLFEMNALGVRFALARLAIDIPGIIIIALAIKTVVPKAEIERIYAAAATMDASTPRKS
ncbi:MAG: permease [Spirochaetes bacterium GWB1_59_5]|nr:MAG: permease [Spirochaetes bacterium GWB1_59_5]